jgi:dGTPase
MSRHLAAYAATDETSRGRRYQEASPRHRTEFQRDRDRIIHSTAFRRLEYKTQVFVNHEGDLYRTRLTHSIEVAQVARSIARALRLNEDLTEAIALAHDLGHTPFGHAGQDALNEKMSDYGGFEHNLQSLRVVDELEERYAEFQGLNLTFESREGILKHCSIPNAKALGELGQRFLEQSQASLEAQLTNLADEIAYNSHDVDDGLRSGLIDIGQLQHIELFAAPYHVVIEKYPHLNERRTIYEVVRRIIDQQVTDLIETTSVALQEQQPVDIDAVRHCGKPLVNFSTQMREMNLELKRFLRSNLYRHFRVHRMSAKAFTIINELFDAFMHDIRLLPPDTVERIKILDSEQGINGKARAVADYIAGMTDRYAILEYQRVFHPLEPT